MKKKILTGALIAAAGLVSSARGLGFTFPAFNAQDPIQNKFADTHFFAGGNSFAGAFFWLPAEQILPPYETIALGADSRTCSKRVRGIYFSSAWGSRMRPLDSQSLAGLTSLSADYANLSMQGGLYTSCSNANNTGAQELYSIYGQLKYTWKGRTFSINMGRRYTVVENSTYTGGPLVSSVQYFNNQTPLGYFYDNIAGIGFIGGQLSGAAHTDIIGAINNGSGINQIFRFDTGSNTEIVGVTPGGGYYHPIDGGLNAGMDTLWRIAVLGNILLSKGGLSVDDRRSILGNPGKSSPIVISDRVNIASNINQLKRNASNLCRGKTVYDNQVNLQSVDGIICVGSPSDDYSDSTTDRLDIDLNNPAQYDDKIIIVYGRNVYLQNSMPQSTDYNLNLFVDRGNVFIRSMSPLVNYFDKDGNLGNPADANCTGQTGCTKGRYIRGNVFINGLLYGLNGDTFSNKLYVHGRFSSLNTALEPTLERTNQIATLFNSPGFPNAGTEIATNRCNVGTANCINFNNTFTWECQLDGMGSDTVNGVKCNIQGDRFKYNPLVVIDTVIPTALLGE